MAGVLITLNYHFCTSWYYCMYCTNCERQELQIQITCL